MNIEINKSNESANSNHVESARRFADEVYQFGANTFKDLREHGPDMAKSAVKEMQAHPKEAVVMGATGLCVGAAVIAESPAIIGLAGAGAVIGGCYIVGDWAQNEVKKIQQKAGF